MINTLTDRNLLILTIYIICVAYILYRAVNSVQDKVRIELDGESLNSGIEEQNLKDTIVIQFPLVKQYKLADVRELPINIQNTSQENTIEVNWDRSTLTDLDGQSRRTVRIIPVMTPDLFQSQVPSVISGGQPMKARFTTEDVLKRDATSGQLNISSPLFDLTKLKKGNPALRRRYSDFMTKAEPLPISLKLVLRRVESVTGTGGKASIHTLSCDLKIKKLPWNEALLWKPKPLPK